MSATAAPQSRDCHFAVGHGPANLCGIFDMPCPANDLGVIGPFTWFQ
jgi:hypothetical protein